MPKQQIAASSEYAKTVAELVATMPKERAAQVYDFVRFLLSQSDYTYPPQPTSAHKDTLLDEEDWLNDSEEQMLAEDALWESSSAHHADKFDALAESARADIREGKAQPMFNEQGEIITDELPYHP